jgi:hypothetical protein
MKELLPLHPLMQPSSPDGHRVGKSSSKVLGPGDTGQVLLEHKVLESQSRFA